MEGGLCGKVPQDATGCSIDRGSSEDRRGASDETR